MDLTFLFFLEDEAVSSDTEKSSHKIYIVNWLEIVQEDLKQNDRINSSPFKFNGLSF